MRLSKRIYKIAELITDGSSVADIGTDHGYVPMLLMKEGRSPRVIMSDISAGSLSKARETFDLTGLSSKVSDSDFRVGDGLATIEAGEVYEVIIAGLGGHTIAEILAADEDKAKSFNRLVLQPRKHSGSLRYYLCNHGYEIESDNLAKEGKFACEIITARPVKSGASVNGLYGDYPETDIHWYYPKPMVDSDPALAKIRIDWKKSSIKARLDDLDRANEQKGCVSSERSNLADRLRSDLEYLESLI